MFEQLALAGAPAGKRIWTTGIGFAGQAVLLSFAFVAPMLWPQILPRATFTTILMPPGTPPPPVREQPIVHRRGPVVASQVAHGLYVPAYVPPRPAILIDEPMLAGGAGVVGAPGVPGGDRGDPLVQQIVTAAVPPPPAIVEKPRPAPAAATPGEPQRIRGGVVKMAQVLRRIEPEYPALARAMRLEGVVELIGVIGVDGRMREVRVVSGHPVLAQAALRAVSQWIYEPTTLNGVPVEVMGPITVTFRLNR